VNAVLVLDPELVVWLKATKATNKAATASKNVTQLQMSIVFF
jgi:hypothetical protein